MPTEHELAETEPPSLANMPLLPSHRAHQYSYEPLVQDTDKDSKTKKTLHLWIIPILVISTIPLTLWQMRQLTRPSASIAEFHYVSEEEWHMPADIRLKSDDPLWQSRLEPFFHEVAGYNHKELGYGGDINLGNAPFVRRSLYRHLLQSFDAFSTEHDFHWWLAHGTLLGQRWSVILHF